MACSAKIILDSVSPDGYRLTTMEVTFPRMVLAEFNTHRVFSRNSASSRAIPIEKMLKRVMEDPFVPTYWGENQKGMQAEKVLDTAKAALAKLLWLGARDAAVAFAKALLAVGVHKQLTNRILEPFMWHTVIVTSSEWSNFYALRAHPDAQPEIREVAELMKQAMDASTPNLVDYEEWHLPITPDIEELKASFDIETIKKISAGRCARVSYLTHFGQRDPAADIELCERLVESGHMSPLEHVAAPAYPDSEPSGNFRGWVQMRKYVPNESDFGAR